MGAIEGNINEKSGKHSAPYDKNAEKHNVFTVF